MLVTTTALFLRQLEHEKTALEANHISQRWLRHK